MSADQHRAERARYLTTAVSCLDEDDRAILFAAIVTITAVDAERSPRETIQELAELEQWGTAEEWEGRERRLSELAVRNARRLYGRTIIAITPGRRPQG